MDDSKKVREAIEAVCNDDILGEPAKFLASLMAGIDPRGKDSKLYRTIKQIRDEDRKPSNSEWRQICNLVLSTDMYRPVPVGLAESSQAAKQLMEYLYGKKKSVSVRGKVAHKHVILKPLTPDEIEEFEVWFTSEF